MPTTPMAAKVDVFIAFVPLLAFPVWAPSGFSQDGGRSPALFNHSRWAVSIMNRACPLPSRLLPWADATAKASRLRRHLLHVAQDGVDHDFASARERIRGCHLAFEDVREACAVGDIEEAQRADRHVQVDLIDPR